MRLSALQYGVLYYISYRVRVVHIHFHLISRFFFTRSSNDFHLTDTCLRSGFKFKVCHLLACFIEVQLLVACAYYFKQAVSLYL